MFYILRLTSEQIREGMLFRISDALDNAFISSANTIRTQGLRGDQDEMLILFENSNTNPDFWNNNGDDVQDVLYLNESAKEVVEQAGLPLAIKDTATPPEGCGVMARMYRFINLS